ncbi:GNAT family N-acetyltransferase [Pseudorhodoferax sp.]|uniref:GNAT family N-acetyltransferase n=1 Tax=Pseudorhodoferax sp. TaxID=1993553 RepID=UPI002DD65F05|nr:GNAT family N-acetyltransferase [Pseudorhodoferax sp.]
MITAPHAPSHVDIRPARPADAAAVGRFVQSLSERSKRFRFHGAISGDSPALQKLLCDVDGVHHQAWLAWADAGRGEIVVGEARFVLSADDEAELAIAVADDWQGRGLADRMLRQLLGAATTAGVARLYGDVMDSNCRMRAFMRRNCFESRRLVSSELVRMSRTLPRSMPLRRPACA